MRSNSCPKCQGSMTEGFVLEHTHHSYTVSKWIEGVPERSFWAGLKLGRRAAHPIQTWRCGRCGYLENYARG